MYVFGVCAWCSMQFALVNFAGQTVCIFGVSHVLRVPKF